MISVSTRVFIIFFACVSTGFFYANNYPLAIFFCIWAIGIMIEEAMCIISRIEDKLNK